MTHAASKQVLISPAGDVAVLTSDTLKERRCQQPPAGGCAAMSDTALDLSYDERSDCLAGPITTQ